VERFCLADLDQLAAPLSVYACVCVLVVGRWFAGFGGSTWCGQRCAVTADGGILFVGGYIL